MGYGGGEACTVEAVVADGRRATEARREGRKGKWLRFWGCVSQDGGGGAGGRSARAGAQNRWRCDRTGRRARGGRRRTRAPDVAQRGRRCALKIVWSTYPFLCLVLYVL